MRLNDSTLVTLGYGVHILARGDDAVQFGVDPTRSGVVETPAARALSEVLNGADWPIEIRELRDVLVFRCGVDSTAARSLIDDLWSYRVLVRPEPTAVAVLGTTPLAREIKGQLSASGATIRVPLINEDVSVFLGRQASSPLVVVDRAHEYLRIGLDLKRHPTWVVPVLSFDSRVIIGPVGRGGEQPCPMCALMRLHDRDMHVGQALKDVSQRTRTMDPVVAAAGAALTALVVRRLTGIPDPPGVMAEVPEPGWAAVVDPLGPRLVAPLGVAAHPMCPVCAASE